jgi:hypothetical protein
MVAKVKDRLIQGPAQQSDTERFNLKKLLLSLGMTSLFLQGHIATPNTTQAIKQFLYQKAIDKLYIISYNV